MQQLSLVFEPGLAVRSRSLREHLAMRFMAYGPGKVAVIIDSSPSHLSEKMHGASSDGKSRSITVDDLEAYIAATGDVSAIHYLADKFLRDPAALQQEALVALAKIAETLPALMAAAGYSSKPATRARR